MDLRLSNSKLLIINFLAICVKITQQDQNVPVVKLTEQSSVSGTTYATDYGKTVYSFSCIPYAAAPVGEFRFMEPQPVKMWSGVLEATKERSCAQLDISGSAVGEEDCLCLNIFTNKLPENDVNPSLDVIVNIHGGAFQTGSGNGYYPDHLMKLSDLVVVSINYRLGLMGFFCTGDTTVPGNNGLKDQCAALKWIKENINKFGGNPDSVTLYGISAGATSVQLHYISPLCRGFFHRGISSSGTVNPIVRDVVGYSFTLSSSVGCPDTSTGEMLKCLQQKPANELLEAQKIFWIWQTFPYETFSIVIEPEHPNAFLTKNPAESLRQGEFMDIPWLFGMVEQEGLYPVEEFLDPAMLKEIDQTWDNAMPAFLEITYIQDSNAVKDISSKIRKNYFGDKAISLEVINEMIQMCGDKYAYVPIRRAAKTQASKMSSADAYCYRFSYRGDEFSMTNIFTGSNINYGVAHGDDIQYFFKLKKAFYTEGKGTESDNNMKNVMCSIVISFIRTGKPVVDGVSWDPVLKDKSLPLQCLQISSPSKFAMTAFDSAETDNFWRSVLPLEDM